MKKSLFILSLLVSISAFSQQAKLESLFTNPPTTTRPYVWWHWMGSNFSKSGITKDLEAMKAMGIGGATIFNLSSAVQESHAPTLNNPWPEQTYRSPAYWEALRFAASEAQRLGMEIGLHNSVGYSTTGGPWINEERSMQQLVWSETTIVGGDEKNPIVLLKPKFKPFNGWGGTGRVLSFYKDVVVLAIPAEKTNLTAKDVLNLTAQFDATKGLSWKAPKGEKWIVYRMGHASTGRSPHPVPDDVIGKTLEADKMSAEQSVFHWNQVLEPVKQHLGEYLGKSFKHMLIDSYEAGNQSWTPKFKEEFIQLKGYDPTPWLLTLGQTITQDSKNTKRRIFESDEITKRFEWDFNDVVNKLFMNNGFKIGKKMLNENNLSLQWEPYGGPFNSQQGAAMADLPMGEFWTHSKGSINGNIPGAAAAAGKTVVGAEAFTSTPAKSKYTEDPAFLKLSTDGAFSSGVNRLILHHWVHQPFDDKYQPGMGMGWWGTHFSRYQTWAQSGKAYFDYMTRCQALLQYGERVSDYLCVENLKGYADVLSVNDFLESDIKIKDGRVVLPSGRSYPFILFSNSTVLPEVARKIKELVANGATIVSPKPQKSPSLTNYPTCDEELKAISDEVWGKGSTSKFGKGTISTDLEEVKKRFNITPDYIVSKASKANEIKLAHRNGNDKDIYFVANMDSVAQSFSVSFRVSGKQPEIWNAEDGTMRKAAVWSDKDGRTTVNLKLNGVQSAFVIFQKTVESIDHLVDVKVEGSKNDWNVTANSNGVASIQSADTINAKAVYASGNEKSISIKPEKTKDISTGNWGVTFVPKLGASFQRTFAELIDFSKSTDKEVMYFAGTATYKKTIKISAKEIATGKRIVLDLGEMNDLAQVKINNSEKGTLWYPPFKVDITDALRSGKNTLQIAVTNNWANRLIGDEKEPADFDWGLDRGDRGRAMKSYPDWFLKNEARPSQGRKTFTIWYYHRNNSPLQPAGLVGPVRLVNLGEVIL